MSRFTKQQWELEKIKSQERKFEDLSGKIYDVANLLEAFSRFYPSFLKDAAAEKRFAELRRLTTLVASHTLYAVSAQIQIEQETWMMQRLGMEAVVDDPADLAAAEAREADAAIAAATAGKK